MSNSSRIVGLLAVAALFLKKGAVLVIGGLAAVAAWFRNLFRKKDI